ncbi:hypothetical protein PO654_15750 [Phytobacter diazotrophicus]|uniref:hypothetical protein n=1 Tax=Phytobacter diazotrophicus TaxID=395631 RepID=UPI0013ECADE9|nr:hypothetical protein [Phytobacter diazotrophicus]QIH63034.1 hypothetical protein CRX67_07815 [Enterobacteriaceae bacterium A-F18]
MMIIKFKKYDDGTYYYHYITDDIRICTDGIELTMETRDFNVRNLGEPFQYLAIRERKDEYFNESLINPYIDTVIEAVEKLHVILIKV